MQSNKEVSRFADTVSQAQLVVARRSIREAGYWGQH